MTIPVALVGYGAWGRNILRVLTKAANVRIVGVADIDPSRRAAASQAISGVRVLRSVDEALGEGARAILIATPPHSHARLAITALNAGADVLVEKPLSTSLRDAERCAAAAESKNAVAMVGHLLRYHPSVERLIRLVRDGAIGSAELLQARRLSLAGDRSTSSIWTLGPHDFSILNAIDASPVARCLVQSGPGGDPTTIGLSLRSGMAADIVLSRTGAVKERAVLVRGQHGSIAFDDVRAPDRLLVRTSRGESEVGVPFVEPLAVEIDHFLRCVERRTCPRTPFAEGVRVVRMLDSVQSLGEKQRSAAADAISG